MPAENIGRAMSDVQRMEGSFDPPETGADGDTTLLPGTAPASTMRSYPMEVVSYTRGRGHCYLQYFSAGALRAWGVFGADPSGRL